MGVEHLTPIKSNVYMHTKQGSGLKLLKKTIGVAVRSKKDHFTVPHEKPINSHNMHHIVLMLLQPALKARG